MRIWREAHDRCSNAVLRTSTSSVRDPQKQVAGSTDDIRATEVVACRENGCETTDRVMAIRAQRKLHGCPDTRTCYSLVSRVTGTRLKYGFASLMIEQMAGRKDVRLGPEFGITQRTLDKCQEKLGEADYAR